MITEKPISHEQFRDQICNPKRGLATMLGWKVQWHWGSFYSPKGWPDLFMVRDDRIIAAELKVGNDKLTVAQEEWFAVLKATGKIEVYEWRPEQIEEIARILQGVKDE